MTVKPFNSLPPPFSFQTLADVAIYLRKLWDALSSMRSGKLQCVTEITLTANSATTAFTDVRLSAYSAVCFDPMTANAAAELAAGTMYVTSANRGGGSWTITNANNVQADRTFRVSIIG